LGSTKQSKKNARHLQMRDLESDDEDGDDLLVFDEPEQKQMNNNFEPATNNKQLNSHITHNIFSDKTYSMILATARVQMQMIEEILFHVLENITQVPPVVWMEMLSKLLKLAHLREIHVEVDSRNDDYGKSTKKDDDDDAEFNAALKNIIRNMSRMMGKNRYYWSPQYLQV